MKSPEKASAIKAKLDVVYAIISRRKLEVAVLSIACLLLLFLESEYAGESVGQWCLIGIAAAGAGALVGVFAAACAGRATLTRRGCGSWDRDCCSSWWYDLGSALLALALALLATCSVAGMANGLLALLLLGTDQIQLSFNLEIPQWVREDIMIVATGGLGVFAVVRFYYKSVNGWYKRGEQLMDDDDGNDLFALL